MSKRVVLYTLFLVTLCKTNFSFNESHKLSESHADIAALLGRSIELYKENQFEQALLLFKHILSIDSSNAMASLYVGHTLKKLKKVDEAVPYFEKALQQDSHLIDAYIEACHFYTEHMEYEKVEQLLLKGLQENPENTHLLFQLATLYNTINRDEESLALFMEVKKRLPHNPSVLYNLAFTLKKVGRVQEAISIYTYALELSPKNAEIKFGRALAYLTAGLFEQGWADYEVRWQRGQLGPVREFEQPLWDGSSLQDKTLFLHAEQGLGDTFQFIRYAKIAKEQGARVIVAVQSPLVTILSLCPYIDKVIALKDLPWPQTDFHAPLASMPYLCKTRLDTVPADIPYLYADEALIAQWGTILSRDKNVKIGIVWNGNSNYSTAQLRAVVAQKSVALSQFKMLADCSDVTIYSLQKETGMDQLYDLGESWVKVFPEDFDMVHGRFMDTAAIIKNLDLIITVDTGTAHLAAGLGAQVWLLLPHPSDWRWMNDRLDTPWYPNVRLFRQPKAGDWETVFVQIKEELQKFVEQKKYNNKQQENVLPTDFNKESCNVKRAAFFDQSGHEFLSDTKEIKAVLHKNILQREKEIYEAELDLLKDKIAFYALSNDKELFEKCIHSWTQLRLLQEELDIKLNSFECKE